MAGPDFGHDWDVCREEISADRRDLTLGRPGERRDPYSLSVQIEKEAFNHLSRVSKSVVMGPGVRRDDDRTVESAKEKRRPAVRSAVFDFESRARRRGLRRA
jgi:hypothetical protein